MFEVITQTVDRKDIGTGLVTNAHSFLKCSTFCTVELRNSIKSLLLICLSVVCEQCLCQIPDEIVTLIISLTASCPHAKNSYFFAPLCNSASASSNTHSCSV